MKVLAINGSPQKGKGNTSLILNPFLEGMRQAGAEVEAIYTIKEKINPCRGCFHCWFTTPGECIQKDSMRDILPKLAQADIWILASPVYADGFTSTMSAFLERILPLVEPFIEIRNKHCRHALRKNVKSGKILLVSNCGFHEKDNFDPMVLRAKRFCENVDRVFAGALLLAHGPALASESMFLYLRKKLIMAAAKKAGFMLGSCGEVSEQLLEEAGREIIPKSVYLYFANRDFAKKIKTKNP